MEVLPFPVAVLLWRIFEGDAGGRTILELQSSGRGSDVRPVSPPALGPLVHLSLFTFFGFRLAGVFRTEVAPGDEAERRQENNDDSGQRSGDQRIAAAPPQQLSRGADAVGPDRLAGQETAQIIAQVECAGIALAWLLLQGV